MSIRGRSLRAILINTEVFLCIPYKAMGQPIRSLGTMQSTQLSKVNKEYTVQCQRYWHCGCGYC